MIGSTELYWNDCTVFTAVSSQEYIGVTCTKLDVWHCMSHSGDDRNIQEVYIAGRMRFSRDELSPGMKLGRVSFSS